MRKHLFTALIGALAAIATSAVISIAQGPPVNQPSRNVANLQGLGTGVATALGQAVSGSSGICLVTNCVMNTPTLGAASATSVAFTGTGLIANIQNAGVAETYQRFRNTTGDAFVGIESSLGGQLITGSAAYSTVITSNNAAPVYLGYQGGIKLATASGGVGVTGTITVSSIVSNTGAQTGYLCYNTSGGVITYDQTNTCLVSSARYKRDIRPLGESLDKVMQLHPVSYRLKSEYNPAHIGEQIGFTAEDVVKIEPRLVPRDKQGKPRAVNYEQMTALLTKAIQEQQAQIEALERKLATR